VLDAASIIAFERSGRFSYSMIESFRQNNSVFSYIISERTDAGVFLEEDPEPERATFVSGNYFSELGVNAVQGRAVYDHNAQPGAPPVVVLSHRYWQRRFGSDPGVVGRVLRLNGKPVEVAGIAPPNFTGLSSQPTSRQPALWFPMTVHPFLFPNSQALTSFAQRDTEMYAALKAGVSLEAANDQLISLATELQKQYPDQIEMRPQAAGTGRPDLSAQPPLCLPHSGYSG